MALGIRGFNPIWTEFDLQGQIFDDTFYMFVLENVLPYIPANVYHDPNLNVVWDNPIQFLANGTLPVDIYFETDHVYRLEFRQGPTQDYPLIYEVNNYIPGSGGSTPTDSAPSSTNQIANPQFAIINFQSPFTLSDTDPAPFVIAPGWFIQLGGTGTITLTQVPLNDTNINPTNAPYALRLQLTGWNDGEVFLSQRFQQNGMLWASKVVSCSITAQIGAATSPQSIGATLDDSNGTLLAEVLDPTTTVVNGDWNEFTGHGLLPVSTNPNTPPSAFIDFNLALPGTIDIYITSVQLIVQDQNDLFEPAFEQDSVDRQIDHLYHVAYPIVPVGTIIDYMGFDTPDHYIFCNGAAFPRLLLPQLFHVLTTTETVTLATGVATFTVVNPTQYSIGMALEGIGIQAATIIINKVGTTITMSNVATFTGPSVVTFFVCGNGNGSTTFNVPNLIDFVTAGALGSTLFGTTVGLGFQGGSVTHTLLAAELPPHSHTYTNSSQLGGAYAFAAGAVLTNTPADNTGNGPGTSTPFSIVQPTTLVKKYIRFE